VLCHSSSWETDAQNRTERKIAKCLFNERDNELSQKKKEDNEGTSETQPIYNLLMKPD
jgi:hypothetical protein